MTNDETIKPILTRQPTELIKRLDILAIQKETTRTDLLTEFIEYGLKEYEAKGRLE